MRPYVLRYNDYVLKLAHQFGFDPDVVWNDARNASLRELRNNPNILLGGDIIYLPDADSDPEKHHLVVGTTNTFVAPEPPRATLSVKFVGADRSTYASRAFALDECSDLTGLATDDTGLAIFEVPVNMDRVTLVFPDTGESHTLLIGALNPIDTPIGLFQRLQNLGHIGSVEYDYDSADENLGPVRVGLWSLRGGDGGKPILGSYPSETAVAPNASPPADADQSGTELSGLEDDWTLAAGTKSQLKTAHGC
jgi:hypothetical protein